MKLLVLTPYLILAVLTSPQPEHSQVKDQPVKTVQTGDITTNGGCSPIQIHSTGSITIRCNTSGLSKGEIERQRQQYAAILNSVRQSKLKEDQILELVKKIDQGVEEISQATKRRSISKQQHDALIESLNKVRDTNLLIDVQEGDDNRLFAEEFIVLFTKDLSWKSAHTRFNLGEVPSTGVSLIISKEDNDASTVPDGCVLAAQSLIDQHLIDDVRAFKQGEPVAPSRGTCTLYISRRKLP